MLCFIKNFFAVVLVFLISFVGVSCSKQTENDALYLLEYDSGYKNIITTNIDTGIFYILNDKIITDVPLGIIEISSCYYDGYAINICMYVETENAELIENKANDEKHSIYPIVEVNNKKIDLSSYGYSISYKQLNSKGTCYKLVSSYNCSLKNIKTPIKIIFDDVEIEIPLVATKGYSQHSQEGQKLWKEYNSR